LNLKCKSYEGNKKTEKEKKKRKEKYETGPQGAILAQQRIQPAAQQEANPNRYPSSLFLTLTRGTHRSVFSLTSGRYFSTGNAGVTPPGNFSQ
jgi:hypothetical protein